MEHALDTRHTLDERKLHSRYYTASLIREAADCHILSADEVARLQSDLVLLLSNQWDRRSHGESSSVPVETAQEMMTSLLFIISLALKLYSSPERAVQALKTEALTELFEEGLKVAERNVAAARRLQKSIADNLMKTPNVFYRSTIVDGIRGFFQLYQPQFEAHEIHITADYPVLAGRPEADGIEFIEAYLRCLEAENAFCVRFRSGDIHRLLCGLTPEYGNIPLNIFEYVVLSAMGLVLVNRSPRKLDLSGDDVKTLCCLFFEKTDEEVRGVLHETVQMLYRCGLMPSSTRSYLGITMKQLAFDVKNAMKTDTMDRIFLVPSDSRREADISPSGAGNSSYLG